MDRRGFLSATLASGLALAAGCVPGRGGPGMDARAQWRLALLQDAWRRAALELRSLLILVVPLPETERARVGAAWGELFGHGPDEALAALSLVEVATATEADLRRLLSDYTPQTPDPTLVLVDRLFVAPRWRAFHARIEPDPEPPPPPTYEEFAAPIFERIRRAATEIESREAVEELVASQEGYRRMLVEREEEAREAGIDARIAALSALVMGAIDPPRRDLERALREDADARRVARVPGARWGYAGGCGVSYDEPDPLAKEETAGFDCGMGHVPARSERFLDFLTEEVEG